MLQRRIRMSRWLACWMVLGGGLLLLPETHGQDAEDKLVSGPQPGKILPGPFDVYNFNGPKGKGRFHCLVCEYAHDPVVMIFAREPEEGKDAVLNELLGKLDLAIEKHKDSYLRSFIVFLSPDARDATTEPKIEDAAKLVAEAETRDKLHARLQQRADALKKVVVACTVAAGPEKYKIDPKADITVVLYRKLKVLDNFAFKKDAMTPKDVETILGTVERRLKEYKEEPKLEDKEKKAPAV